MQRLTGVYKITNLVNSKFYIGSSAESIKDRWSDHKSDLNLNKHANKHLQRAWNKYGEENFLFEELEICEPDLCLIKEQFYLDLLLEAQQFIKKEKSIFKKIGYNLNPTATSRKGAVVSKETKEKISKSQKGRIPWNKGKKVSFQEKERLKNLNIGKKHSQETKDKKSLSMTGKKWSEEAKQRFSKSKIGIKQSKSHIENHAKTIRKQISQYTLEGIWIKDWDSIKEAQDTLKIRNISAAIKDIYSHSAGFKWKLKQ